MNEASMAYGLAKGVLRADIDGEAVLLDSASGHYFGLNPTATRMLAILLEFGDSDEALSAAEREFELPRAREDFSAFASDLKARGLVVSLAT